MLQTNWFDVLYMLWAYELHREKLALIVVYSMIYQHWLEYLQIQIYSVGEKARELMYHRLFIIFSLLQQPNIRKLCNCSHESDTIIGK